MNTATEPDLDSLLDARLTCWGRTLYRGWREYLGHPRQWPLLNVVRDRGNFGHLPEDTTELDIVAIHRGYGLLRKASPFQAQCIEANYLVYNHKGKRPPVAVICRVLQISRTTYYKRLRLGQSYIKPFWQRGWEEA